MIFILCVNFIMYSTSNSGTLPNLYLLRLLNINITLDNSARLNYFFIFLKEMASKFHSGLSLDLFLMLNDADDHNVIIQVGKNQNIKEFRAHSNILKARSPYFKSAFSAGWVIKNNNNMIEFKKPNINPTVFEIILK